MIFLFYFEVCSICRWFLTTAILLCEVLEVITEISVEASELIKWVLTITAIGSVNPLCDRQPLQLQCLLCLLSTLNILVLYSLLNVLDKRCQFLLLVLCMPSKNLDTGVFIRRSRQMKITRNVRIYSPGTPIHPVSRDPMYIPNTPPLVSSIPV